MGCQSSKDAVVCPAALVDEKISNDFHSQFILGVKLGRGAFAQVRETTRVCAKTPFREEAVKIIDMCDTETKEASKKIQKVVLNEISLWKCVGNSSHCVQLFDAFFTPELTFMVMERCSMGLFPYLEGTAELNEHFLKNVLTQMLVGIRQLHCVLIVHRDIKPDNYMIGMDVNQTVKLCDFGLSAKLPPAGQLTAGQLTGVYGTAPFMCPEMLEASVYNEKADLWSVGVIAYALLYGNFPYLPKELNSKSMKKAISAGVPPSYEPAGQSLGVHSQFRSRDAVQFVRTLLDRNPLTRPSAAEAALLTYVSPSASADYPEGAVLPSLRSMLYAAKKVGAFEVRDTTRSVDIDAKLHELQMEKHGKPLLEGKSSIATKVTAYNKNKDNVGGFENACRENSSNISTALDSDWSPPTSSALERPSGAAAIRISSIATKVTAYKKNKDDVGGFENASRENSSNISNALDSDWSPPTSAMRIWF